MDRQGELQRLRAQVAAYAANIQVAKIEGYKRGYLAGLSKRRQELGPDAVANAYQRGYQAGLKAKSPARQGAAS